MSLAAEVVVYEDQTHLEEYEEIEEAVLEELLQEAEVAVLEQELSDQDPDPLDEDKAVEDPDNPLSEEGEPSSLEKSTLLESSETEVDVESVNGLNDLNYESSEVIEIVEEDVIEQALDFDNVIKEEVGVEEHDSILITTEEVELNGEVQEQLETHTEDQIEDILEENDVQELLEIEEVTEAPELTELEQHDDHLELDDSEDVFHQEDPLEIPDVEEVEQYNDSIELEEEESIHDELFDLEETEDLQTVDQGDIVNLQDKQEELRHEEDLIDNIEENLDEKIAELTDHDDNEKHEEELIDSPLEIEKQLEETNTDYVIEEQHSDTSKEESVSAEIETLEKEFSQLSEEYQSVFTPQEQFIAHFMADLSLFETIQTEQERHASSSTVSEKYDLSSISLYSVSFNEDLLPPISLDHFEEELSSLDEELACLDSPRAFQHFHEQLQESHLQLLTLDPQLSLDNLADDLKLVSQGDPLPDPPPYDFLAELESFEEGEAEARFQELKNPLYPYFPRTNRLLKLKLNKQNKMKARASQNNTQRQRVPKGESHDEEQKESLVNQQTIPVESIKSNIIPSQKLSPSVLTKLKVPSARGVIRQQIEALDKLKSLDHEIDTKNKSARIITLKASSKEEMGEVLMDKMGDFTHKSYVLKSGRRNLSKLTRSSWKQMTLFIKYGTVEKEIYNTTLNQTDWVTYNISKGWKYTGNQRIVTKVNMDLLKVYYARLEEQARNFAMNNKRVRSYLSKFDKNSIDHQNGLKFCIRYGYRLPERIKSPESQNSMNKNENVNRKLDSAFNYFIKTFNANMQSLMNAGTSVPLEIYETLEKAKIKFPDFVPVFRYEGIYFFMENYNDLIRDLKPWEQITKAKGGPYTTVFHTIEAIRERTFILKNPFNDKTYRTIKEDVFRVTNRRGFYNMYRKLRNEPIRSQLMEYNNFSPQQTLKAIWEELHPLKEVEYVLRAYLNEQKRMNRLSTYLKVNVKEEISNQLEGFTSITDYPPSAFYTIKVFDTEKLIENMITNNMGIANPELINSAKVEEFISLLDQNSSEIGTTNLSEVTGAVFEGERIITVATPSELISNGKILKAFFESCSESHLNAIPRFFFQSPKWVEYLGLDPDHTYTAYNTGNTGGLDQDKVAASGRQDFTIVDELNTTHAIAQNKLLRTEASSSRSTYLAEIARDLVATQGFGVPGYNIFTLLNHDAKRVGISPSTPGANITYVGVTGGVVTPSSGIPKLGQITEWAMYKANDGKGQVTCGSNLIRDVGLQTLINEAKTNQYASSKKTIIPCDTRINNTLIERIQKSINSTNNPLEFLLDALKLISETKSYKSHTIGSNKSKN